MPVEYSRLKPKGRPDLLADEVPWRAMIAPGVIAHKARHALQRSYLVRGPDLLGESDEVQGATMLQINEVLKRLGGQWMLQAEAQRTRVTTLPPVAWPHPLLTLLDTARRTDLLEQRESRETTYYLTLTWIPPGPLLQRGWRFFLQGPGRPSAEGEGDGTAVNVRAFIQQADFLMDLLRGVLAVCQPLTSAQTSTYLHKCVSDRWYDLGLFADMNDLDHKLCDTPLDPAGWYPELGRWHLRTASLSGYPATSMVGIMRQLDAMNLDYRWSTRWLGMEKQVQGQILKKLETGWVGQEKSAFDRMVENTTGRATRVTDPDAINKAMDVNAARQEIGMDLVAYGHFSSTITVWDEDPLRVDTKLMAVMEALANAGFTSYAEEEHATAAWFSSHPGNRIDNVRRTAQNSLTVAHLAPGLNATWPGPERDDYLGGGPWFYAQTDASNILRVVNHLRDLGMYLVLGSTRSGKSTFANFKRARWMQYPHAQATLFEQDGHGRLLTHLLGGAWYDLGAPGMRCQPLRHVDDPARYDVALQWVIDLLTEYHVPPSAFAQAYVGANLRTLARLPAHERTLSRLVVLMAEMSRQTELSARAGYVDGQGIAHRDTDLLALVRLHLEIRTVLKRFTDEGEYGGVFDGTTDPFEAHAVQTFELAALLQRPSLLGAMMRHVLMQVDAQMSTTAPMLLQFDDAAITWIVQTHQPQTQLSEEKRRLEQQLLTWLMTRAKKGVSLGIYTHSLAQVFNSSAGPLLVESCPSRFFMPNPSALEPEIMAIYQQLGLTENAIRTIAMARPQRDVYYYAREVGQRPFTLPLTPFELDCYARNRAEDHELMDKILTQEGREGFPARWLRDCGYEDEAVAVETTGGAHAWLRS